MVAVFAPIDFDSQLREEFKYMKCFPFLLILVVSAITAKAGESDITGLWQGGFSPATQEALQVQIDGTKSPWQASVKSPGSAVSAPVQKNQNKIQFTVRDGEFRGRLIDSKTIVGHWIQPANEIYNNRYATPLVVSQADNKIWRIKPEPLEKRLRLWMSVKRGADGSVAAVIRNPEFNLFRRNVYRVAVHDNAVTFTDAKNPMDTFEATLITAGQQKILQVARLRPELPPLVFWYCDEPEKALGFVPDLHRNGPYLYSKPTQEDDDWKTASLSEVGLNQKRLSELIERILRVDPLDNGLPIHSLLIARHGKLVLEEYFYGFNKDRLHDMRSASKTFATLIVGIARDKGAKIDTNTPVYAQFPEYKDFANGDPRKSKITVRDLMTMTSGLACDDNDENSPGNEDVMQQQTAQPDWYKYTLDLPIMREPGGDQAVYCSAGINLLGGIVRNATHTWLPDFFYENVANPLQIKMYHWNLMPNGEGYAGGGLYLRPRDQLKLGQLYLNGGVWNGKHIVSKDWVERSTSRQSTFGKTLGADHDYGYGWHLYHFEVEDHSYQAYAAGGNGGQIAMVIPDLDLVVGFTGGAYGEFAKWYRWQTELVPQFIIPAAAFARQPPV